MATVSKKEFKIKMISGSQGKFDLSAVFSNQTDFNKMWAIKKVMHLQKLQKGVCTILKNHAGQWLSDVFNMAKVDFRACA